jgi:alkanesulfonate monooxygenase SsuD/methylene tetrahydromethanopterin reductase-like flavin-dependent oxidoreductase (luciferase family)
MAAATVDELSAGPFILSMGSSRKVQVEPEHGAPYGKPLTCVRESIEIIRKLTQASHDGRLLKAAGDQGGGARRMHRPIPETGKWLAQAVSGFQALPLR